MSQTLGLLPHFCVRTVSYMAIILMEWSQYFHSKIRDGEEIPFRSLVVSAWPRLVYFNLLTVFFALYFKLTWADFHVLRRHRDRLYYLVQFASALEHGFKDMESYQKWRQSRSQAPQKDPSVIGEKCKRQGLDKGFRFALYVSPLGENIFQTLIEESINAGSVIESLEKVETFTAEGTVLRIWYGSYWDTLVIPVIRELLSRASEDDFKAITSFPEGDVTEVGHFYGPLRLMSKTDFDYDLSKADGPAWFCPSCREVFNDYENHGFLREWKAVEVLGNNGHSLATNLTEHINGEVYCQKCGCYNVTDEKTGQEVNNSY